MYGRPPPPNFSTLQRRWGIESTARIGLIASTNHQWETQNPPLMEVSLYPARTGTKFSSLPLINFYIAMVEDNCPYVPNWFNYQSEGLAPPIAI